MESLTKTADNKVGVTLGALRRLENDLTLSFQRFEAATGLGLRGVDYEVIKDEAEKTAGVIVRGTDVGP